MYKVLTLFVIVVFFIQCRQDNENQLRSKFNINGQLLNNTKKYEKIYLGYELQKTFYLVDSANIQNNSFHFKGKVAYPQKAQLLFYEFATPFQFILTGENIDLQIDAENINNSKYANSAINDEFQKIKYQSVNINNAIDYLYPQLQKARLSNDYEALQNIINEIKLIERQNSIFLLQYLNKHPQSRLAALLLNDLYTSGTTDTITLKKIAQNIQPELKKALYFEP